MAKCGKYSVYENRSTRSGRQIELNVVVLPATGPHPAPDALFFFAGGPGGAATSYAPAFRTIFPDLNKTRDIVLVDQRGVGGSNPLFCPEPGLDLDVLDGDQLALYYRSCLQGLEADLRWYTTRAYVDDVDDVRRALGYERINIGGESYGATVVQVYLLQHPEAVRTAAILRGTLLNYPILEHFPDSSQRALDLIFERCEQDHPCSTAFPELQTEFADAAARLEQGPVPTSVWDPSAIERIVVTPGIFANVIHYMLMDTNAAAQIPWLVHRAAKYNDWDPVADFYLKNVLPNMKSLPRLPMAMNILCTEPWAIYRPDAVVQNGAGSHLVEEQTALVQSFAGFCTTMPEPDHLLSMAHRRDRMCRSWS